jgi:hypothetical protein
MTRGVKFITGCACPVTPGQRRDIGVTTEFLDRVARHFPPRMLHELRLLVPETLRHPDTLWAGIREPDPGEDDAGYCFAKHFPYRINGEGGQYPNKEAAVFCVYVNNDFLIYEYRWDESDRADHRYPRGHESRFQRHIR